MSFLKNLFRRAEAPETDTKTENKGAERNMTTAKDIVKMIKEEDIKYVDFRFTDPRGKWQHVTFDVSIVDEEALIRMLAAGDLAGAGLDVRLQRMPGAELGVQHLEGLHLAVALDRRPAAR